MDKYVKMFYGQNSVAQLLNKSLTYEEFVYQNNTKCSYGEKYNTRSCKEYTGIRKTFQAGYICFTLFHRSDGSNASKLVVDAGYAQSAFLVSSKLGVVVDLYTYKYTSHAL